MDSKTTFVTKETKNKIRVDYEGKLSLQEKLTKKLKESYTWIKIVINVLRLSLCLVFLTLSFIPSLRRSQVRS